MIYENGKDREQQHIASHQFVSHLTRLGVTQVMLSETPEHRRECYDFELHVQGMFVGVVEVKSRRVSSQQIEDWGSIIVEKERLTSLRSLFYRPSEITGRSDWTKEVVFLFRCRDDDVCYAVNIRSIVKHWDVLEDAPPEMMKDNHGTQDAVKTGKLVPVQLLEKFT